MKRIILLISFLTVSFFMQAQEKINFQLNGETIEFNISQEEMYVEYAENQKSAVQRISKDGFEEISPLVRESFAFQVNFVSHTI